MADLVVSNCMESLMMGSNHSKHSDGGTVCLADPGMRLFRGMPSEGQFCGNNSDDSYLTKLGVGSFMASLVQRRYIVQFYAKPGDGHPCARFRGKVND